MSDTAEPDPWQGLLHAYGRAVDTPRHLQALKGTDADGVEAAFDHLWSAVLHQGTIFPATAPTVDRLLGALAQEEHRSRVIAFVAEAFRSAADAGELSEPPAEDRARLDEALETQIAMHARFLVVRRLCRAARDFDALLPVALACLPLASRHTVEHDRDPFLAAAERLHPGEPTEAVRTYRDALAERSDLPPADGAQGSVRGVPEVE